MNAPENIPFVDLKAAYHRLRPEIDAAVAATLEGGWYILGEQVRAFEEEFAAYLSLESAVGLASGTDAILLALRACGVGPVDVVVRARTSRARRSDRTPRDVVPPSVGHRLPRPRGA